MRESMIQLSGFLGRRRRWVLAGWVVVLLLALPLAAKQTDNLTGGGFDVPGSQSKGASEVLEDEFASRADGIAVVFRAPDGADAGQAAAAVSRVEDATAEVGDVSLAPAAA